MSLQRKLFLIAVAGVVLALFWQELNAFYNPVKITGRSSFIITADDASYLLPAENYIKSGVWKDGSDGITQYYQRPPGYGILYLFLKIVFHKHVFIALKIVHAICFFISVLLVGKISFRLSSSELVAGVTATIFALMPMFSGFMYYTLTEAITPFLILLVVYSFISDRRQNINWILILSVTFLLLTRPQLLPIILALALYAIYIKNYRNLYFIFLAFIPFTIWQIRTYTISNEVPGLHPIYSYQNNHLYRPGHEAMTNLFRIWEHDGSRFHSVMEELEKVKKPDYQAILNQGVLIDMHNSVKPILIEYKEVLNRNQLNLPDKNSKEEGFVKRCRELTKNLKKKHFIRNYLITPFKSAIYLLSKSHLNLPLFQKTFRGNWFVELLRFLSVSIIIGGFLAICTEFVQFKFDEKFYISLGFLLYFVYLVFIQKMNEERYLTPFLPIFLIYGISLLNDLNTKIKRRIF